MNDAPVAQPLSEWLLSKEAGIPNDGLIIHATAVYIAERLAVYLDAARSVPDNAAHEITARSFTR
jgi:hypothetical protein